MTNEKARQIADAVIEYLELEQQMTDPETPRDELSTIVTKWVTAGKRVRAFLVEGR